MKSIFVSLFLLLALSAAVSQGPQGPHPGPGDDPIGRNFFPPELVMQNQEAVGLNDDQKTFLKTEIRKAQMNFTDLQWKLQDEVEKMASFIKQPHPDEQQILGQLEKVLGVEREIKRAQITLLVRIKNKLTPEQQAKLEDIRRQGR